MVYNGRIFCSILTQIVLFTKWKRVYEKTKDDLKLN